MAHWLRGAAVVTLVAAAFAAPACRGPTEVWVEISTDVKCADLRGTTLTIGHLGEIETKPPAAATPQCADDGRIGALVVVPSGDNDAVFAIKIVAGLGRDAESCAAPSYGPGCIVARRALRFLPSTSVRLPVFVGAKCSGVPCEATQTCVRGVCQDANIDAERCAYSRCDEDTLFPGSADGGVAPSPEAGGSDGGTTDAPVDACPVGRGPSMVVVNVGGRRVCIDSNEVVEEDYATFRTTGPGVSGMPAPCSFKTTLSPAGTGGPRHPVAWVDWCDAYAFCAWAGKRLCTKAEWTEACTGGTTNAYPYGPTFDPSACNDTEATIAPVRSFAGCVGGVAGLHDMSGNVDEWIDSCVADAGPRGSCESIGGDFNDTASAVTCTGSATSSARDYLSRVRGFRCCAR